MDDFERELKEDFIQESADLLSNSEGAFLELEKNKSDSSLLDEIFRLAHNLKGTSKAVGFDQIADVTHKAENLILKLKEGSMEITDNVVSALLDFNDFVVMMIDTLKRDMDATFDTASIEGRLQNLVENGDRAVVESEEQEDMLDEVIEAAEETEELEKILAEEEIPSGLEGSWEESEEETEDTSLNLVENELEEVGATMPKITPVETPKVEATPSSLKKESSSSNSGGGANKKEDESIRVSLSRVERLNNIVGELVILQTVLDQRRYDYIKDELSNKSIIQLGKLSKEIQEISMSLRMIPLKSTFQKMSRIVRDASKSLGKKVRLNLVGEETEIDKTVLERLGDPLVHIVRNAIDHGLEAGDDRLHSGKTEEGNVEILAQHEGSNLVIQITDDGKGIHPDVIKKKAIEKGLLREGVSISDQEIIQYIFHPGFSTKEQVTELSGRGVGMDVVKTNIESISGHVAVMSKVGVGSSFKIVLPLTLAIIEGVIVECGADRFILPHAQASEFVRIDKNNLREMKTGNFLHMRGEVITLFHLSKTLGRKVPDDFQAIGKIAVIIRTGKIDFAVMVDDIVNQQQVVIKKLGEEVKNRKGYMGSSILGDGRPALIVDLVELYSDQMKVKKPVESKMAA